MTGPFWTRQWLFHAPNPGFVSRGGSRKETPQHCPISRFIMYYTESALPPFILWEASGLLQLFVTSAVPWIFFPIFCFLIDELMVLIWYNVRRAVFHFWQNRSPWAGWTFQPPPGFAQAQLQSFHSLEYVLLNAYIETGHMKMSTYFML